ncbi:MAG: glycosyltransferase [Anaerolineales bacterium]|nr:glycosyltransferase [Anaerolineales bacterium]
MNPQPLVSIITPSFNQANFLEETILSVLGQDYPHIEYLVIDGGSTDGSVEIIEKYADRLAYWVSEKDQGQADAINKGFSRGSGEIVAWINSDDKYLPGAVSAAVKALLENPSVGMIYGDVFSIGAEGKVFNTTTHRQLTTEDLLSFEIISQPTVFMRRAVLEKTKGLNLDFHYLLDHQLWLQMAMQAPIVYLPRVQAAARYHADAKNIAQGTRFGEEAFRILEWAETQPALAKTCELNKNKALAGAYRLDAHYLLDAGKGKEAFQAYLNVFQLHPKFALERWYRVLFSFLSLIGLDKIRPWIVEIRRKWKNRK